MLRRVGGPARLVADEPREDHDALRGRVQRMAGGEHEPVVARALGHPRRGRRHDPRALDLVGEVPVGHAQMDRVAVAQLVELAERRAVGRAMTGDRHRAADPGQRRARIVAGALAQVAAVGPRHEHRLEPDARDGHAPERVAVVGAPVERPRREAQLPLGRRQARDRLALDGRVGLALDRGEAAVEPALLDPRVDPGHGLLPEHGHRALGEKEHADHDQQRRERAQVAAHGFSVVSA